MITGHFKTKLGKWHETTRIIHYNVLSMDFELWLMSNTSILFIITFVWLYRLIIINKRFIKHFNYSIDCVKYYKKQQHRFQQRDRIY